MNLRHIFILPALLTAMACSDDSPVTPDTPDTPEGPDITNSVEKLVSIDAGQTFQTIAGFGASDCWTPAFVGNSWTSHRAGITELLFSSEIVGGKPKGIGLSQWRVNLGGGSAAQGEACGIEDKSRHAESYLTDDLTYDWTRCEGQRYFMDRAKELGCNKIALGHHFDDVIETILMGMLYSGKVETMMPKLHSQNFEGMELIRPMYLIKESAIKAWRDTNGLHFIQCACRFTENCVSCGGGRGSKRDEMKELVAQFRNTSSVIETNIFNSVRDINLRTVMGYHKDGEYYNFLDDYDQRGNKGADKEKE